MPAAFPTLARLKRVAAIFCFALASAAAAAEGYPERPVTFVVPYTAGSQTDQVARLLAQALQGRLGQPFLVENKAGSSGLLAALDGGTGGPRWLHADGHHQHHARRGAGPVQERSL